MKIEVITTGDEIMTGITLDTNFAWMADKLSGLGFDLAFHTSVRDDREEIMMALLTASERVRAVIVSGGLGPTPDDLTAEVASRFFDVPLESNGEALEMIEERFRQQGRRLLDMNRKQAYIPRGVKLLKNFWGTAPGFQCEKEGVVFFFLPGVPKEFKAMVDAYVLPALELIDPGRRKYQTRLVRTFGLRESEVADRLKGMERGGVSIGYRAHFPEIHLRVSASGNTETEAGTLISDTLAEIKSRIGDYVFSTNGETLEEVVGRGLTQKNVTLSLAESCTGGLVAHRVTNIPGSSNYFDRGVVCYSNESKIKILGVPKDLLESFGAVSGEVVRAMAEGVRTLSGSDLGVGISGIAGPGGGSPEKPVGTVYIGISHLAEGAVSRRFQLNGTREEIKLISSELALDYIRKFLSNDV